MNSINTNFAALTALQSLNQTNQDMLTTQSRISTGFKIDSAADGAAYWSMATTMRSDNAALSAVTDALGLGSATIVGFQRALARDMPMVATMDADFSHDPDALVELVSALDSADESVGVVIGSRYVPGGAIEGWSYYRR